MGWASGGYIYEAIAKVMDKEFGEHKVQKQARILGVVIGVLEDGDCDVLDDFGGISEASDLALKEAGYHVMTKNCRYVAYDRCSCGYRY